MNRRKFLRFGALAALPATLGETAAHAGGAPAPPMRIHKVTVTPIALPDPPILAASGCHGPYFLRNVVQIETDAGVTGIGETRGGLRTTEALVRAGELVTGKNAFAYRQFAKEVFALNVGAWAAIELACLDACGKATGRRICELLGGPVREDVEFAAYLFYRFAADHPSLLADPRIVDARGKGDKALDDWGEVRTPETMVQEAERFRKQWGFRVFKLKAGVLPPEMELETMKQMNAHFRGSCPLRIDPNAAWSTETAIRLGKELRPLNLEYYEDPVSGQAAMAEVRRATGLKMATNMCVTRFDHVPEALGLKPIDVVLADNHYWGGLTGCLELGRVADLAGWSMGQHSNSHAGVTMAAMIHLAALVPQLAYASDTHYPWLPENADILAGPKLVIRGGKMSIPEGPGLGVALDMDRLARGHELYQKCGMRERDDARTMRLVEPGFQRGRKR